MMAKVVDDGNTTSDAANFHSALDALEGVEGRLNLVIFQSAMFSARDHRQRIAYIQFTDKIRVKFEAGNLEFSSRRAVPNVESLHGVALPKTEPFDGTMCDIKESSDIEIVAIG